jgi:hypothetical protein
MAKPILVLDDLKTKFSQFNEIADITTSLRHLFDTLNTENLTYAGHDDQIARAYHKEIDEPTKSLVDLVDSIARMFTVTGAKGGAAANDFEQANNDAGATANNW